MIPLGIIMGKDNINTIGISSSRKKILIAPVKWSTRYHARMEFRRLTSVLCCNFQFFLLTFFATISPEDF